MRSPKRKQGRVLLQFLKKQDLKRDVTRFCAGDYLDEERFCVIAKDRELKVEPRFFCKKTLFARFMQTLAESNVKDNVLPYIQFQSISLSEVQLSQRLANITRFLAKPEEMRHVIIVIDVSSSNLRFHYSNMWALLRDL